MVHSIQKCNRHNTLQKDVEQCKIRKRKKLIGAYNCTPLSRCILCACIPRLSMWFELSIINEECFGLLGSYTLSTVTQIIANYWIFDWLHMHIVLRKIFSLANTKDERNSKLGIGFARWNWITVEWVSLFATSNRLSLKSSYNPLPRLYLSWLLRHFSSRIYMPMTICSFNPLRVESAITWVVCANRCYFLFKIEWKIYRSRTYNLQ